MRSLPAVLAVALLGIAPVAAEDLRIVASTTDLGAIARAVVGEDARIDVVARPDRDPHVVQVRPSTMKLAARADFYLAVGLSLDLWSDSIVRGSRNRDLVLIDCSRWIDPLEVPAGRVDASMGDVHPEGNPHWWLDPVRAADVARGLAVKLGSARPERATAMAANAELFAEQAEAYVREWEPRLAGGAFVEYHQTWTYFADRFALEIISQVEPLPGIPPSARQLAATAEVLRLRGVQTVVRDPYHSDSPVEFLVREVGAVDIVLPAACPEPTPESYFEHLVRAAEVLSP